MVAATVTFLSRFRVKQSSHPWILHGVHADEPVGMDIRTNYKRLNVCQTNLHTQEAIPSIFFEDAYSVNIFRYLQSMENEGNRRTMAGYMV
ncbi:hypothetical protein HanIR_Chr11g0508591 [Helianthus annuus]|nr:hypothetical protein HanIR_Chr11g0508591 [Helianthus annuus]